MTPLHLSPPPASRDLTLGDGLRAMSHEQLGRTVAFALDMLEFYASPYTYAGVAFLADPPCGDIVRDFGDTWSLGQKPGRRARLAHAWLVIAMARACGAAETEGSS